MTAKQLNAVVAVRVSPNPEGVRPHRRLAGSPKAKSISTLFTIGEDVTAAVGEQAAGAPPLSLSEPLASGRRPATSTVQAPVASGAEVLVAHVQGMWF